MDEERILAKIDEIRKYIGEIKMIAPKSFDEYQEVEKKRACERILQISIESVIDVCNILVSSLKIGLPSDEEDIIFKLADAKVISHKVEEILYGMKGFRNILVHKYGVVDDEIVYEMLSKKLDDFEIFIKEVLNFVKKIAVNCRNVYK